MKRLALSLALVAFLGGCQTISKLNAAEAVILACEGYFSSMTVLTAFANERRLTGNQIAVINRVRPFLMEICLNTPSITDPHAALDRIRALMVDILVVQHGVPDGRP